MEDKTLRTLLLEKETVEPKAEKEPIRQAKVASNENLKINLTELKQKYQKEVPAQEEKKTSTRLVGKNQINFFAGEYELEKVSKPTTFEEPIEQIQDLSSTIETPNYDLMDTLDEEQEKKIFVVEKSKKKKKPSPLLKKLKIITFALLIGVLGSWTVYNAVELSNVVIEYNLKLDQYLLKLGTLDSASNMNDLFPTYPEDSNPASSIEKKSNWFDRLCNFIAGIFGG